MAGGTDMIGRFERFSYAIAEMDKNWHKIVGEEMERCGLNGAHAVYLLALFRKPDGMTAPQLCESCGKDKADASRMLRSMEEKGLVRKEGPNQGRYGGTFFLTESGMEIGAHIQHRAALAVEYAGSDLSEQERDIFYDALDKIMLRLRELCRTGIPQ